MRPEYQRQSPKLLISASAIAAWAYCPESWRLEYGLGLEPGNRQARSAGTGHHMRKAVAERVAGGSIMLGWLLAFLAALALLLLLWRGL